MRENEKFSYFDALAETEKEMFSLMYSVEFPQDREISVEKFFLNRTEDDMKKLQIILYVSLAGGVKD